MGKTGKASANLEIAEDIVFWFLSPESSKLVVRSTKGKGLDVFKNYKNCDVLPCNKHPFFVKEEKNIEWSSSKKTKLPRLKKGDFRLWTIPLGERTQEKNTTCKKICVADTRGTNRKWLITFPVVNAEARIFGVIDCLRDKPLSVEDENVLKQFLRRISLQFYSAFSHYHFKKVRRIRKELFVMTGKMLAQFQTEDVYQELVRYIREEFVCKDCDLFLDNRGKMLLRSTTRKHGPASDKDKSRFSVEHDTKKNEIMGKCLHTGKVQIKHVGKSPISSKNLSSCLQKLFSKDFQSERMVIPLKGMIHGREKVIGMFQLKQPLHHSKKNFEKKYLKKSLLFTSEDFRLGIDLGFAIQRIVQMVSLVEQQRLLLDELTHSLWQPLQVLRSTIDRLVGAAIRDDKTKFDIKKLFDEIKTLFDLVHEAKNQFVFFNEFSPSGEKHQFEQINLKNLIWECCDVMAKRDLIRKNPIDYSGIRSIESVPVVTSRMRKALLNLLDNAIKYSYADRDVMVIATEDNQGRISIKVTNWGVGIPKEDQQCVFDSYFRSNMPDRPGTGGIGLTIVKEVVERIHKGKITVTSIPYKESEKSTSQIIDIEYETSFTIELERKKLDSLAK
jgi:signal transduction histidine kinase